MTTNSKLLSDKTLNEIEAGIDNMDYTGNDIQRLINEVRRQRAVLDQVDAATKRIDAGVDRAAAGSEQVAAELARLRTLIVDYATTPMTFEQMLEAAFGEQRANEIMGITDEQQAALLEQWHERLPGDNHADRQD